MKWGLDSYYNSMIRCVSLYEAQKRMPHHIKADHVSGTKYTYKSFYGKADILETLHRISVHEGVLDYSIIYSCILHGWNGKNRLWSIYHSKRRNSVSRARVKDLVDGSMRKYCIDINNNLKSTWSDMGCLLYYSQLLRPHKRQNVLYWFSSTHESIISTRSTGYHHIYCIYTNYEVFS